MESIVLLSSTGMIRSVAGGAVAVPSSGRRSVKSRVRVRDSILGSCGSSSSSFIKRMEQALLVSQAQIRSDKGCAVRSARTTFRCSAEPSRPYTGDSVKPHPEVVEGDDSIYPTSNEIAENQMHNQQQKKSAKIHDFCFGIPFGGAVLIGGLVSFSVSRDVTALCNSIFFGIALLGLSTSSLKIWRQGKSSFPHILGQAVIAAILLWNSYQGYLLTKKIFPHAFYGAISAAMLCFYAYVVISGGNPPPKKLKASA